MESTLHVQVPLGLEHRLDPKRASVPPGSLLAMDVVTPSPGVRSTAGAVGASEDAIVGVWPSVASTIGVAPVVSAAPKPAEARGSGSDVDRALEGPQR